MAKGFTISLDDKELNNQIKTALKRNPKATVKAIADCALDLAGRSAKAAPIESGDLRNNCNATINGSKVFENQTKIGAAVPAIKATATVGYSLPYALRQHEELDYSHNRTDGYIRPDGSTVNMVAGGQAKFLEKPFEERKQRYIERIKRIPDEVIK